MTAFIAVMKAALVLVSAFLFNTALHAGAPATAMVMKTESAWDGAFSVDTGWSQDHFEWTIAGDLNGQNPNVLSELDWRHLNIFTIGGQADFTYHKIWHLELSGGYGWIASGGNRDSDYYFDNHSGEFSRSVADTRGSRIDADLVIGRDFQVTPKVTLTPQIGFTYHRLRLNDREGVQVIDTEFHDVGPFAGLDSLYTSSWWGPTFGLQARVQLAEKWRWLAGARFELLRYKANADWNLRTDFRGFHDTANGNGWLLTTGVEWDFAQHWTLSLLGDYSSRRTGSGTSDTLLNDYSHDTTRFNGARWESFGARVIATYRF